MKNKLLVISAVWCPSCLILNKHLKRIKEEYDIDINKLDYDLDEDEVEKYNIGEKLPVMILLDQDNNETKRVIGEKTYEEIIEFLEV